MILVTHLKATNDINGNPRRLYVITQITEGERYSDVIDVIDEGYAGDAGVRLKYPGAIWGIAAHIPVKEYNDWLRYGDKLKEKRCPDDSVAS